MKVVMKRYAGVALRLPGGGANSTPAALPMKLRFLVCLLLAVTTVFAEVPPFSCSPLTIVLESDATHQYRADPESLRDGKLVYAVTGQVFDGAAGGIAPAMEPTARTSPWLTLSELLTAYAAGDGAAIRALYTAGSAAFFERLEAKPELRERWLATITKVKGAKVLLAYRDGARVVAFVKLEGGADACPFVFEEREGRYLLSTAAGGSGGMFWNLGLALANFRLKPGEIVHR